MPVLRGIRAYCLKKPTPESPLPLPGGEFGSCAAKKLPLKGFSKGGLETPPYLNLAVTVVP